MNSSMTLMPAASDLRVEAVRVRTPYAGLDAVQACSAPTSAVHGTTVPAGKSAVFLIDGPAVTAAQDVQGSPPREAPV